MAAATDRVKQILSWYSCDNLGVKTNLARLLNHGALAGTGKLVILPVDQGFEHGPARSFAPNPAAYDPDYHFQLAIDSGCNAYAAPLGFLEASADKFAGPGPAHPQAQQLRHAGEDGAALQRRHGEREGRRPPRLRRDRLHDLPGLGRAQPHVRGPSRSSSSRPRSTGCRASSGPTRAAPASRRKARQAVDVTAYAAQISCQLGAHVVKVKPPKDVIEQAEAKKVFEKYAIPTKTLAERVRHCVQSAFNGKRIVIFSGGEAKGTDDLLEDVRGIAAGGGFGSIMGRNAFQRPRAEALKLLADVMEIFRKAA